PGRCALRAGVLVADSAALELKDVVVRQVHDNPTAPCLGGGDGIVAGFGPTVAELTVKDVVVTDRQGHGILVFPGSTATIEGSEIVGSGVASNRAQAGILVRSPAATRIVGNTIHGHLCGRPDCGPDPFEQVQAAAVFLVDAGEDTVVVAENDLSDNDSGVYVFVGAGASCCVIRENRLT